MHPGCGPARAPDVQRALADQAREERGRRHHCEWQQGRAGRAQLVACATEVQALLPRAGAAKRWGCRVQRSRQGRWPGRLLLVWSRPGQEGLGRPAGRSTQLPSRRMRSSTARSSAAGRSRQHAAADAEAPPTCVADHQVQQRTDVGDVAGCNDAAWGGAARQRARRYRHQHNAVVQTAPAAHSRARACRGTAPRSRRLGLGASARRLSSAPRLAPLSKRTDTQSACAHDPPMPRYSTAMSTAKPSFSNSRGSMNAGDV